MPGQEPTTPSRITRGSSKEVSTARIKTRRITDTIEEEESDTPESSTTPPRKTRRISLSSRDEMDDNRSEISVKSTRSTRQTAANVASKRPKRTRGISVSSSDSSPVFEEGHETYSQSRRLTRRQQAIMERASKLSQHVSTQGRKATSKDEDESDNDEISDSESVVSHQTVTSSKSKQSTASKRSTKSKKVTKSKSAPAKRSTRSSSKTQQESEVINEEIGTRKRKTTKPVHLSIIQEEEKCEFSNFIHFFKQFLTLIFFSVN